MSLPSELSKYVESIPVDTAKGSELLVSLEQSRGYTNKDRQRLIEVLNELGERDKYGGYRRWYVPGTPYGIDNLPKHRAFFNAGAEYDERLFSAGNRVGKALPNIETVHTLSGPVKMGDLKVGDYVVGSSGDSVLVTGYYPQGERPVYRLTTSDGSSVLCDSEHLWRVRNSKSRNIWSTLTTSQLLDIDYDKYALPARPCISYTEKDLPLDPYLLGLLIGDGGLSQSAVYITSIDEDIINYCSNIAPAFGCSLVCRGAMTYQFVSPKNNFHGNNYNMLRDILSGMGLDKTSKHKRIPEEYFYSSESQRLALLQGLFDTDGHCGKNGSATYYSVNKDLCEDVARLVRSLGVNCSVSQKNGRYKGQSHISWLTRIRRSDKFCPFRLRRKADRWQDTKIAERGLMIKSIEYVGIMPCSCITVAADDRLFSAGDYLLTHNSVAGAFETACHLTGEYPSWWEGRVFDHPVDAWACGKTSKVTRDTVQKELVGEIIGEGMIPRNSIAKMWSKQGTPRAIETVEVKHSSGGTSRVTFKSYEEGTQSFYGTARHLCWLDEEADEYIYSECFLRTATTGGIIYTTFTPKHGVTPFVLSFLQDSDYLAGSPKIVFSEAEIDMFKRQHPDG